MSLQLTPPQLRLLSLPHPFRGYVGGFGAGKTFLGMVDVCAKAMSLPVGSPQGLFAPAYHHVHSVFLPTLEQVAPEFRLSVRPAISRKEILLRDERGTVRSTLLFRSMDDPGSIVGFNIAHALIDELDILPDRKAAEAWRKIIARLRHGDGRTGTATVTTTPEGFRFVHKLFVQNLLDSPELASLYGAVHASTRENAANLPAGFIESLEASYPPALVSAYIDGQFVNLTQGSVYDQYDRERCGSTETVQPGDHLHVGMDFNVMHMAAVVFVEREGVLHAVAEEVDQRDTPAMALRLQARFPNVITVYPDASGAARNTAATETDFTVLRRAGFRVVANPANPAVRERVMAVNSALMRGRVRVNVARCPRLADALERQCYDEKTGAPDKTSGYDHVNDAAGYCIVHRFPVMERVAGRLRVGGV